MQVKFKVHAVVDVHVQRDVEVAPGVKVAATINGLRVELVGADAVVGSLTLQYVAPADVAAAREAFVVDEDVTFTV